MLLRFYTLIQNLSLDVMAGAMAMSHFVAVYLGVDLAWSHYVVLGLSVWLFYTIDHLLDARQIEGEALTARHRFHQVYFKPILYAWLVIFIASVYMTFAFLPNETIRMGVLVSGIAVAHQVIIRLAEHKYGRFMYKEFRVALGYALGVFLGPVSTAEHLSLSIIPLVGLVFILALINLLLFSRFDESVDKAHGHTSAVTTMGIQKTDRLLQTLFYLLFGILGMLFFVDQMLDIGLLSGARWLCLLLVAGGGLLLLVIFVKRGFFAVHHRYRMLGDFVFLLPAFLLFI